MYILKTEAAFDSAHFLYGYEGKCHNIHGHRWRITAEICGETLVKEGQERGMLVDFSSFKKAVRSEADELDHCLIIEKGTLSEEMLKMFSANQFRVVELDFRPTAENLAAYIFERLRDRGFDIYRTEVYETPENCAVYSK
ncbi:MAG: 6-carboxytetrahydropterin synthase [Oscillospiraceae bacterium]|nr:6-carboxytetrahydropterin synthase [Oscillospiraceae bacterium]